MINNFESKVAKVTDNFDEITGTRNINYDVYKYGETSQGLTGKSKPNMTISFSSLMDSMDFYRQGNLQRYLSDDYLKDGTVTIVRLFDDRAGTTIITPPELAKKLLKEESNRYSFAKKIEVPELEFEKLIVENARRNANKQMPNAPKFERFTEPGGEDYTELVFKIKKGGMDVGIPTEVKGNKLLKTKKSVFSTTETREMNKSNWMTTTPYKNPSHMNTKSEIAHVRFKTRYMEDPTMPSEDFKVLTVEEMQSDFATAVRKGQMDMPGLDDLEKQVVQDFPFKNTWYEMTTKRLIRYAADNGFDAVAIPKGSVAAKRYGQDILKATKATIQVNKYPKGEMFMDIDGKTTLNKSKDAYSFVVSYTNDAGDLVGQIKKFDHNSYIEIKDIIGAKEFKKLEPEFKKIIDGKISGIDQLNYVDFDVTFPKEIVIGSGKGKVELYDKAIPSFMKKYGKKWNAKVYDDMIDAPRGDNTLKEIPVTIIKLTPEMKKAVQQDSQALFEILGIGAGAGIAAESVSDNIQNNTISN